MRQRTIRFTSTQYRALRAALAATLGVLVLAACGGGGSAQPPTLLVSNTLGNNVVSLNSDTGAYLGDFIAANSGDLTNPDDMTVGPDGHLYVSSGTDTTGQILRYHGTTGA